MKIRYKTGMVIRRPEDIWDVDYVDSYSEHVEFGRVEARRQKLAIVSICRNAMPHLRNTLALVDELAGLWRDCALYVYENDSTDETATVLDDFAIRQWVTVEHDTLGGEDTRGFQPDRTIRLAKCRTRCQEWVRRDAADANYVMVLDADPHGGFSVDGVLNSLGWFCEMLGESFHRREAGAMASYSLYVRKEERGIGIAGYDAYAARLNHWEDDRQMQWFHMFMPPVGSVPIPMNSAFGGLCLYRREAYLAGVYEGGDCEHVLHHKAMQKAGYQLFMNPGSRYVAILP
jgi:GNAT superfamily N-acetyltransferase